jgi:hypothetical protein
MEKYDKEIGRNVKHKFYAKLCNVVISYMMLRLMTIQNVTQFVIC